jgi:hypothetical protein
MSQPQHLPCVERLEQRRLLASTLVADELVITGTANDDFIWIEIDEDRGMLLIDDNGHQTEYELATISHIRVFGYAGNDYLYADQSVPVPLYIDGGDGDDQIYGGAANDHLIGGAGNDTLVGADGGDRLVGGDGNDVLSGNNGNDAIFGDAGNDTLHGGWGSDYIDGGDDIDALRGDYDADEFAANSLPEELLDFSDDDTLLVDEPDPVDPDPVEPDPVDPDPVDPDPVDQETDGKGKGKGPSGSFKGFDSHAEWLEALKADAKDNGVRRGQVEPDDARKS